MAIFKNWIKKDEKTLPQNGIEKQIAVIPEDLQTFFTRMSMKIVELEQRIRNLELNEEDLRNRVLRKIQKAKSLNSLNYGLSHG